MTEEDKIKMAKLAAPKSILSTKHLCARENSIEMAPRQKEGYYAKAGAKILDTITAYYENIKIRNSRSFKKRTLLSKQKSKKLKNERKVKKKKNHINTKKNLFVAHFGRIMIPKVYDFFKKNIGKELLVTKAFKNSLGSRVDIKMYPFKEQNKVIEKGTKIRILSIDVFDGFSMCGIEDSIEIEYTPRDTGKPTIEKVFASELYSHTVKRLKIKNTRTRKTFGGKRGQHLARQSLQMKKNLKNLDNTYSPLLDIDPAKIKELYA